MVIPTWRKSQFLTPNRSGENALQRCAVISDSRYVLSSMPPRRMPGALLFASQGGLSSNGLTTVHKAIQREVKPICLLKLCRQKQIRRSPDVFGKRLSTKKI